MNFCQRDYAVVLAVCVAATSGTSFMTDVESMQMAELQRGMSCILQRCIAGRFACDPGHFGNPFVPLVLGPPFEPSSMHSCGTQYFPSERDVASEADACRATWNVHCTMSSESLSHCPEDVKGDFQGSLSLWLPACRPGSSCRSSCLDVSPHAGAFVPCQSLSCNVSVLPSCGQHSRKESWTPWQESVLQHLFGQYVLQRQTVLAHNSYLSSHRNLSTVLTRPQTQVGLDGILDGIEQWLCCFGRSMLMFCLVAFLHLVFWSIPCRGGQERRNASFRCARRCLYGAPILWTFIIVSHLIPVVIAAPEPQHALEERRIQHALPAPMGQLSSQWSDESAVIGEVVPDRGRATQSCSDFKMQVVTVQYQRSCFSLSQWWDRGMTPELLVAEVSDDLELDNQLQVLVPASPQPSTDVVVPLETKPWLTAQMNCPVLIQLGEPPTGMYMEYFVGRITHSDIRLAVGPKWTAGSFIFMGDSVYPLEEDAVCDARPGMLIRVVVRRNVPRVKTLDAKLCNPCISLRNVCSNSMRDFDLYESCVGAVGPLANWETFPVSLDTTSRQLQEYVAEECSLPEQSFHVRIPCVQPCDLTFRGVQVTSLMGVIPACLEQCTYMFVDPRALGKPVCVLLLPPAPMTITSLLHTLHAAYPVDKKLVVRGAPFLVQATQLFVPGGAALITFEVESLPAEQDHTVVMDVCQDPPSLHDNLLGIDSGDVTESYGPPCQTPSHQTSQGSGPPESKLVLVPPAPVIQSSPHVVNVEVADELAVPVQAPEEPVDEDAELVSHSIYPFDQSQGELLSAIGNLPPDLLEDRTGHAATHREVNNGDPDDEPDGDDNDDEGGRNPVKLQILITGLCSSVSEDTVGSFMSRARIILAPLEGFFRFEIPTLQPDRRCLTVFMFPAWWSYIPANPFLIVQRGAKDALFVQVARPNEDIDHTLPLHGQDRDEHVHAYTDFLEGEVPLDQWPTPPIAATVVLQSTHLPPPILPNVEEVLSSSQFAIREADVPDHPHRPGMQNALLGVDYEQTVIRMQTGAVNPQVCRALHRDAHTLALWGQLTVFEDLEAQGTAVGRCIGFRDAAMGFDAGCTTIFIDGRLASRPVCCRVVRQNVLGPQDVLDLLGVELPEGYHAMQLRGRDPQPVPHALQFLHCQSVTVWLVRNAPPPQVEDSSSECNTEDDHVLSDSESAFAHGEAQTRHHATGRSRSPRPERTTDQRHTRSDEVCMSAPCTGVRIPTPCWNRAKSHTIGPSISDSSHDDISFSAFGVAVILAASEDGCVDFSNCPLVDCGRFFTGECGLMWMPGFLEHARAPCLRADTSVSHLLDSSGDICTHTVLASSPQELRAVHLQKVSTQLTVTYSLEHSPCQAAEPHLLCLSDLERLMDTFLAGWRRQRLVVLRSSKWMLVSA